VKELVGFRIYVYNRVIRIKSVDFGVLFDYLNILSNSNFYNLSIFIILGCNNKCLAKNLPKFHKNIDFRTQSTKNVIFQPNLLF